MAFGDEAPSNRTVYNWFAEFQRGCTFLSDEFREGRPSTFGKNASKIGSSVCKNVSILKANISKNNKAIYRILHVFFSYCLQKLFQQPTYIYDVFFFKSFSNFDNCTNFDFMNNSICSLSHLKFRYANNDRTLIVSSVKTIHSKWFYVHVYHGQ